MTFTANAATTAHTIAYSAQALTGAAATASATAGAYTVAAGSGGRTIEISVDRRHAQTHTLPNSVPSAVDPLSSRTSSSTLAVATGSNRGKRPATSQWDL